MTATNDELFARARAVIPGGVDSPVRAYGSVGGTPRFIVDASGPYVTDAEGRRYVDLVASWGPALLGHAHPEVVAAVQAAAARGLSFGAPTPAEAELVEEIITRVPFVERARLVSTGTEATMTAIRLARGATGRDLLIKFAGHYHGHSDGLLAAAGSGLATYALPGSAGVPEAVAAQTLVVPYNDRAALEAAFAAHPGRIAAVITEAAAANMGVVAPASGFTTFLAELCRREGALLISDEVLTGFRAARGGYAQVLREAGETLAPDLVTFGKVIGGGLPVAAVGGRADVMEMLAPMGPVYQAGTLSGNPVAVAAGTTNEGLVDGPADEAWFAQPSGLAATEDRLAMHGEMLRTRRFGSPTTTCMRGSLRHPRSCRAPYLRRCGPRAFRTSCSAPGHCSVCSSARRSRTEFPTTRRRSGRTRPRTDGSSTRCWMPVSRCRRRRTRPGS